METYQQQDISALVGETITSIRRDYPLDDPGGNPTSLTFQTASGRTFRMGHDQDCCERVDLIDTDIPLSALIGETIVKASVRTNKKKRPPPDRKDDSWTWTFYVLRSINVSITLRWLGTSNGYYSEAVDFGEIVAEEGEKR